MAEALSTSMVIPRSSSQDRATARLQVLFADHYDAVWRFIRRLGVRREAVDDVAQDAFLVVARRLSDIEAGKERAFLFSTAMRVAADSRKRASRSTATDDSELELRDPGPIADELIDQARARALCDRVLDTMPIGLRAVFVLFQTGEMTMAEIAMQLELAPGTVASRIRRARELFEAEVARLSPQQRGPR